MFLLANIKLSKRGYSDGKGEREGLVVQISLEIK